MVGLALLAVLVLLGLPLLEELATQSHWLRSYDGPTKVISELAHQSKRITALRNFDYLFVFLGGMTFATVLDAFFERIQLRRSKNYASLGDKAIRFGQTILAEMQDAARRRDSPPSYLLAELNVLLLDLKDAGIPVPVPPKGTEVDRWLETAGVYLSHIGPLLRDGRIGKAKRIADLMQMRLDSS
jgi:hypothetical protein